MMNHNGMSDFEINCEVLSVFSPDIKYMCLSEDNSYFYNCGPAGDRCNQIDIPDYCNNAADAWSIITENNISLILDNPSAAMATCNCVGWYSDEEPPIHASNQNPLRAAMIVFLMMQ